VTTLLCTIKSKTTDNLGFIKTCQDALPKDTNIKKLRIDAAGYQASIIDYCFENDIEFSIRAAFYLPFVGL
jgi:hypothetical protein